MKLTETREHGFTLIELMVAIGISTVLMAAIFSFLLFTSRTYRSGQASLKLQREAARAVEEMAQAVRSATTIGPAGDVTDTLSVTTPDTTYAFAAPGGALTETVGNGAAQLFFDDPAITAAALSFTKLPDPSGAPITSGITIRLTLSHPAVAEPVTSSASVNLRNALASVATPAPTPTPPALPLPTLPLPTATIPLPTPTVALPSPTIPLPTPGILPTSGPAPGLTPTLALPTATVPLPTATIPPAPAPTATRTPTCVLGVCI